jgi:long-subunit fatty acid transport protein
VPFYMRPYLTLRGAPAMRYQGESVAQVEAEVRWQFWQRFSVVGFAGAGTAQSTFSGTRNDKNITTIGAGMRYEIARKHGLHMGIDFAAGPDSKAIYIQFGSAWMRP